MSDHPTPLDDASGDGKDAREQFFEDLDRGIPEDPQEQINVMVRMINTLYENPDLLEKMAAYGYDKTKLSEGLAIAAEMQWHLDQEEDEEQES